MGLLGVAVLHQVNPLMGVVVAEDCPGAADCPQDCHWLLAETLHQLEVMDPRGETLDLAELYFGIADFQ